MLSGLKEGGMMQVGSMFLWPVCVEFVLHGVQHFQPHLPAKGPSHPHLLLRFPIPSNDMQMLLQESCGTTLLKLKKRVGRYWYWCPEY